MKGSKHKHKEQHVCGPHVSISLQLPSSLLPSHKTHDEPPRGSASLPEHLLALISCLGGGWAFLRLCPELQELQLQLPLLFLEVLRVPPRRFVQAGLAPGEQTFQRVYGWTLLRHLLGTDCSTQEPLIKSLMKVVVECTNRTRWHIASDVPPLHFLCSGQSSGVATRPSGATPTFHSWFTAAHDAMKTCSKMRFFLAYVKFKKSHFQVMI